MYDTDVRIACANGDAREETYCELAKEFHLAHQRAAGGVSIEVGTRRGGSAVLMLRILDRLYGRGPLLITIDPYGGKPYYGGEGKVTPGLYGDEEYIAMKTLLAPFPNHVHFAVTSMDFISLLDRGFELWSGGRMIRFGTTDIATKPFTFVYLDGDHDKATVLTELDHLAPRVGSGGSLVIDNVDDEPALLSYLTKTNYPDFKITFPLKDMAVLTKE